MIFFPHFLLPFQCYLLFLVKELVVCVDSLVLLQQIPVCKQRFDLNVGKKSRYFGRNRERKSGQDFKISAESRYSVKCRENFMQQGVRSKYLSNEETIAWARIILDYNRYDWLPRKTTHSIFSGRKCSLTITLRKLAMILLDFLRGNFCFFTVPVESIARLYTTKNLWKSTHVPCEINCWL